MRPEADDSLRPNPPPWAVFVALLAALGAMFCKPDLQFGGTEYAQYEGDRISQLRDELDPGTEEHLNNWLDQHGKSLST